jgi:hypothetical protein
LVQGNNELLGKKRGTLCRFYRREYDGLGDRAFQVA